MNGKEILGKITELFSNQDDETPIVETELVEEVIEEETKEVELAEEEVVVEDEVIEEETPELTIEMVQEQLIALAQIVAELQAKVDGEELVEEEKEEEIVEEEETKEEEEDLEKINQDLMAKIEKLETEQPVVEPVLNLKKENSEPVSNYEKHLRWVENQK